MNSLPILLLLPIKDGVLVLRHHLLLPRHLRLPPLNRLGCDHAVLLEGRVQGVDDLVDGAETLALAGFLGSREAPWDFPVGWRG